MQAAGIVTKAAPWIVEGRGDHIFDVRYVGIKPYGDFLPILSEKDNLLLKFSLEKKTAWFELYLANSPPFISITSTPLSEADSWEPLLGEIKRRLKKDYSHTYCEIA